MRLSGFFQFRQVRKRLFALERVGIHAQLLKCFNGESALEQTEPITRGCPLYIAGVHWLRCYISTSKRGQCW
jgi:hypothetical protein